MKIRAKTPRNNFRIKATADDVDYKSMDTKSVNICSMVASLPRFHLAICSKVLIGRVKPTYGLFDCRFSKSFQMVFNMKSTFTCT